MDFQDPTLLGLIGGICSVIGVSMGILSHISTRRSAAEEASRKCHEDLLAEERRSETLSRQLQEIRLKHGESDE